MVLGLGTDLIETKRVQESIERFGERFLERIFTAGEIAYCKRKKKCGGELCGAVCGEGGRGEGAGDGDQPRGELEGV